MPNKKEATEKFHAITEAKDTLLSELPVSEAPLSAQKAYDEFKRRHGQTSYETWKARTRWEAEEPKSSEPPKKQWKGPSSEATSQTFGGDFWVWTAFAVGLYYFIASFFPPAMRKKTSVSDKKPEVELGLREVISRRIYHPKPVKNKFYRHQGRIGPHTHFQQMDSGPATANSIFKCLTCNMAVSKQYIDHHVRTYAYKYTL